MDRQKTNQKFNQTETSTLISSPCMGCTDRHVGCHSTCTDRYIPYKEQFDLYKKRKRDEEAMTKYYQRKYYDRVDKWLKQKKQSVHKDD